MVPLLSDTPAPSGFADLCASSESELRETLTLGLTRASNGPTSTAPRHEKTPRERGFSESG